MKAGVFFKIFVLIITVVGIAIIFLYESSTDVDTIAIVTRRNQNANIFIFFEQDTVIGNYEKKKGRYFFFAESDPSIFFLKEKLGEGNLENYILEKNKLKRINYVSEMTVKDVVDNSYQVIGGSYRGVKNMFCDTCGPVIRFITFKAGLADNIKYNFMHSDSTVISMYKYGLGIK